MRHTASSLLIAAGADLATVSKHTGHANLAITLGAYGHWFERNSVSGLAAKLETFLDRERDAGEKIASVTDGRPAAVARAAALT